MLAGFWFNIWGGCVQLLSFQFSEEVVDVGNDLHGVERFIISTDRGTVMVN